MGGTKYGIADDSGEILASGMTMETALILIDGLFCEYYKEPHLSYTIFREETDEI